MIYQGEIALKICNNFLERYEVDYDIGRKDSIKMLISIANTFEREFEERNPKKKPIWKERAIRDVNIFILRSVYSLSLKDVSRITNVAAGRCAQVNARYEIYFRKKMELKIKKERIIKP